MKFGPIDSTNFAAARTSTIARLMENTDPVPEWAYAQSLVRAMWALGVTDTDMSSWLAVNDLDTQWFYAQRIETGELCDEFALKIIAEAMALRMEGK